MARTLTMELGDGWAEFSGYGSRELYVELRRRPPVFNVRTRRWTAQITTARDLVALAESRGWAVVVNGAEPANIAAAAGSPTEPAPEPEGLW